MIKLRPFRALHYNHGLVKDLSRVIAPPYDVIDDAHVERLYARDPHNVVRLILNRETDRYAAAAADLASWRERKILVHDAEPCLYFYVQDFKLADGSWHRREGLMAAVRLDRFENGNIRPHERTFARAKADRLKLLRACQTNLSPLFGLYTNRSAALAPARQLAERDTAWVDVTDEYGERHRVWRLSQPSMVDGITRALGDGTIFIADGHHRYETALAYRDERVAAVGVPPDSPVNFVLMYLMSMDDPGLVVLPTHRVLRRWPSVDSALAVLAESFAIETFPGTPAGERDALAKLNQSTAIGCLGLRVTNPDRFLLLTLRDVSLVDERLAEIHPVVRRLDVSVLDAFILRGMFGIDCSAAAQEGALTYTHDTDKALRAVPAEGAAAAFLLRPPRIQEVEAVCMSGEVMPEKSTYFYPKLLSGLVLHALEEAP